MMFPVVVFSVLLLPTATAQASSSYGGIHSIQDNRKPQNTTGLGVPQQGTFNSNNPQGFPQQQQRSQYQQPIQLQPQYLPQQPSQQPSQQPYNTNQGGQYQQYPQQQENLTPEGTYLNALHEQQQQQQQLQHDTAYPQQISTNPSLEQRKQPNNFIPSPIVNGVYSKNKTSSNTSDQEPITISVSVEADIKSNNVTNTSSNDSTINPTDNKLSTSVPIKETPIKTGMDQKDGQADSLVDYALGLAGYKTNSVEKSGTTNTASTKDQSGKINQKLPSSNQGLIKPVVLSNASKNPGTTCESEPTLEICPMPTGLQQEYFQYGLTVKGVLSSIFKPETSKLLAERCEPGTWCLSYTEHLKIMDGMERLYLDGPLCSAAMRECLITIADQRQACGDKRELTFLTSTVKTLCDLSSFGLTDKNCYTSATEALYTLYVHMFPPNKMVPTAREDFCHTFTANMAKTYLCADDACSYDQEEVLKEFKPWENIADNATTIFSYCNMTDICPYEVEKALKDMIIDMKPSATTNDYDYAEDYYDYGNTFGAGNGAQGGQGGVPFEDNTSIKGDSADKSASNTISGQAVGDNTKPADNYENLREAENHVFFGLVLIVTLAGVVIVVLSVVSYRRFSAGRAAYYNRGYSQLTEEESARMLRNDFS